MTERDQRNSGTSPVPVKMVGLVCERSVELDDRLDANGCLLDDPTVKIIQVPCSGIIQPIMMETALKKGAHGCFATGCRMGDCHYRDGNRFLRERLLGTRMPKIKPNVNKDRIEAYWLSAVEYETFVQMVGDFHEKVDKLGPPEAATGAPAKAVAKEP